MISQKKNFLNTARIILLGAPLFLTACSSDFGPFPMPSGYAHHNKAHKAPPGPEPVIKKIEHRIENMRVPQSIDVAYPDDNGMMMDAAPMVTDMTMPALAPIAVDSSWNHAAHDLVTRLVNGFGQPTEPVYIEPSNLMSHDAMSLGQALRTTMMQKEFNVATAPGMGPYVMHYTASPLNNIGDGSRMIVTISLMNTEGENVAEESGIYDISRIIEIDAMPRITAPEPYEESGAAMAVPISIRPMNN